MDNLKDIIGIVLLLAFLATYLMLFSYTSEYFDLLDNIAALF